MFQEFKNHLQNKFSFLFDKKLLLAISGGVDSMVLLELIKRLNLNFAVAHCNFNLRNIASDLDQKLVEEYCKINNIEIYINTFNTVQYATLNKQSIQIAARELRYNWFDELLKQNSFDYLLTAHHLDDSVETFLINFTRGTGIDGLVGIPEINQQKIRPLLIFSRDQILDFAKTNNISWREDESNASTKYLRNKIRHDIIPILKNENPEFLNSFQKTISNLNEVNSIIKEASEIALKQVLIQSNYLLEIDINKLKKLENYKSYLYQWLKKYNFKEWNDINSLINSESGKKILSDKYILLKNRDSLILDEVKDNIEEYFYILDKEKLVLSTITFIFEDYFFEDFKVINSDEIILDENLLQFPLKLRKWQKGDYFFPLGMEGSKKVSKFFKDQKFSLFEKQNIWILENANQQIIWIVGYRMDNRFKVTNQTIKKIKIKITK